jgi:hypothetical protein
MFSESEKLDGTKVSFHLSGHSSAYITRVLCPTFYGSHIYFCYPELTEWQDANQLDLDMAAQAYALREGKDIKIKYIGLRPGEKLYEELLMNEEGLKKTASDRIFIGRAIDMDYGEFLSRLDSLRELVQASALGDKAVERALSELVPTFCRYESPSCEAGCNNE